jgi:hypothetical protein
MKRSFESKNENAENQSLLDSYKQENEPSSLSSFSSSAEATARSPGPEANINVPSISFQIPSIRINEFEADQQVSIDKNNNSTLSTILENSKERRSSNDKGQYLMYVGDSSSAHSLTSNDETIKKNQLNINNRADDNSKINENQRRPSIFDYMNENEIENETFNDLLKLSSNNQTSSTTQLKNKSMGTILSLDSSQIPLLQQSEEQNPSKKKLIYIIYI